MDDDRFSIILEQSTKDQTEQPENANILITLPDTSLQELREIDELRRLAFEVSQPPLQFYTGT